jgi:hypothetical protein
VEAKTRGRGVKRAKVRDRPTDLSWMGEVLSESDQL